MKQMKPGDLVLLIDDPYWSSRLRNTLGIVIKKFDDSQINSAYFIIWAVKTDRYICARYPFVKVL